jgi:hypothetical protein
MFWIFIFSNCKYNVSSVNTSKYKLDILLTVILMHIANPIYAVVFKYLMEDSKITKLLISSIISKDIKKLRILPQEFSSSLEISNTKNIIKKGIKDFNL